MPASMVHRRIAIAENIWRFGAAVVYAELYDDTGAVRRSAADIAS